MQNHYIAEDLADHILPTQADLIMGPTMDPIIILGTIQGIILGTILPIVSTYILRTLTPFNPKQTDYHMMIEG